MSVPLAFFVLAWTYCFSVNFIPSYREPADRLGTAEIGLKNAAPVKDVESGSNGGSGHEADLQEGEVEKDKGGVVHQDKEAETAEIQEVKH